MEDETERWTPERSGPFYCSAGCGYGCTWSDYVRVTAKAKRLAGLCGEGFKPEVWENLGWHFKAVNEARRVEVWRRSSCEFQAVIAKHWSAYGKTPQEAMEAAYVEIRAAIKDLQRLIRSVK